MTVFARRAVALVGIAGVFGAQFAHVRPTNFSGYDEWLYLSLASRWIIGQRVRGIKPGRIEGGMSCAPLPVIHGPVGCRADRPSLRRDRGRAGLPLL